MLTQIDGKGNITTMEYNAGNKVARRIDHGGRAATSGGYKYDSFKVESYTYNADGSMKSKTDRNGITTEYSYDVHGRLTSQRTGNIQITYTNSIYKKDKSNLEVLLPCSFLPSSKYQFLFYAEGCQIPLSE